MKFSTVASQLLVLAAAVAAADTDKPAADKPAEKQAEKPAAAAAAEEVPFKWPSPFKLAAMKEYQPSCEHAVTLQAAEYQLHDLYESPPLGLWPWADALKLFFGGQEYPGSWEGVDPHRYDRQVLKMEYADLPNAVRHWIATKGQKLFAIYEKPRGEWKKIESLAKPPKTMAGGQLDDDDDLENRVAIFAPGALYEILPLFTAEGSKCADSFLDIEKYSSEPKDGAVVAGITDHSVPKRDDNERDITIKIKAQVLKLKEASRDEL